MRGSNPHDDAKPLDPIALTLAVWLGVVASVTGLVRLGQDAADQAAITQAIAEGGGTPAEAEPDTSPFSPRLMAFGG
jgi:hypothetical protein